MRFSPLCLSALYRYRLGKRKRDTASEAWLCCYNFQQMGNVLLKYKYLTVTIASFALLVADWFLPPDILASHIVSLVGVLGLAVGGILAIWKSKNHKKALLWALYVLLLGQFLYSNFVSTLGSSYIFPTADYPPVISWNCPDFNQLVVPDSGSCVYNCPEESVRVLPASSTTKGFPVTLFYDDGPCDDTYTGRTNGFVFAVTLNILYIAIATALFGYVLRKQANSPKKVVRRRNR